MNFALIGRILGQGRDRDWIWHLISVQPTMVKEYQKMYVRISLATKFALIITVSAIEDEASAPISPVAFAREQFLGKYL